jgi:hypothetical protein
MTGIEPRFLDLALVLIAIEAIALIGWRVARGSGPKPLALLANLGAGAMLLAVARAMIGGASGAWIAAALAAALLAHLLDLAARWERGAQR